MRAPTYPPPSVRHQLPLKTLMSPHPRSCPSLPPSGRRLHPGVSIGAPQDLGLFRSITSLT